jgi:hypothetical protein
LKNTSPLVMVWSLGVQPVSCAKTGCAMPLHQSSTAPANIFLNMINQRFELLEKRSTAKASGEAASRWLPTSSSLGQSLPSVHLPVN